MPRTKTNRIEIAYETTGDPRSEPLLLIAGLGSQLHAWPEEICEQFARAGFFVIRFDNRDVGLSTKFDGAGIPDFTLINAALAHGEVPNVPYSLEDMANDAVGLLDALQVSKAHVCGASMGGMIAQAMAYLHPGRVASLAIIMSTTGDPALPPGKPEILMQFFAPLPNDRAGYIAETVRRDKLVHGTMPFDEALASSYRAREYDRCHHPTGPARQLAALAVPGNIQPKIRDIKAPTVVIHGREDPFYPVEVGKAIAGSIPGAKLLIIDGMGHSFPREAIPRIVGAIVDNSTRHVDTRSIISSVPVSIPFPQGQANKLMDDIASASFEQKTGIASLALVTSQGEMVFQSKNWNLTNQADVILDIARGSRTFILNGDPFTVKNSDPTRVIALHDGGMGSIVLLAAGGCFLISYVMPGARPEAALAFLDQQVDGIAGSLHNFCRAAHER